MAQIANYGASVGFDISSKDWEQAYTSLDAVFSRGEVTGVDSLSWKGSESGRPLFTRMAVDSSGATVTVGFASVVPGFLSHDNKELTFVAAVDGGENYGNLGQCFFDSVGLIPFEEGYEAESVSSTLQVDLQRLDEDSPTVWDSSEIEAALKYVPLNLGAHLHLSDPFEGPSEYTILDSLMESFIEGPECLVPPLKSTIGQLGYLALSALFDASSVRVTRSQLQASGFGSCEDAEEETGVKCTELSNLTGPEEEISGLLVDATRHHNRMTDKDFWELILELKNGKRLRCFAPHPFAPGSFESVEPYSVGAMVTGDVLFTGHFLPLEWGGSFESSHLQFPIAIDMDWLHDGGVARAGVPSARTYPLSSGFHDANKEFNFGRVITDIGGCLGFTVSSSHKALLTLMNRPARAQWASANRALEVFSDDGEYARATMCLTTQAETMPEWRRVLFGMSLPTMAWGAGISVDTRFESLAHYAAVDCQLCAKTDITGTSFEELLTREVNAEQRGYGEPVVTALHVWMPEVHRNPFSGCRFLSVHGYIGRESMIYLPCPDWLEELCDEKGDDADEVAYVLQNLHGKVLVGRLDNCQVDFDGCNVNLDRFDEEIYSRIPESILKRVNRRSVEDIDKSWTNPEVALNTEAVFNVYASEQCTTADLMTSLLTGPNGLNVRRADIFDTRLVNIYEAGQDDWRVEWPEGGEAIMLLPNGPGMDSADNLDAAPADSGRLVSSDPSVRDYLTDEDSFEQHLELVRAGIAEGHCLSILYGNRNDEPTARIIRPVRIVELGRPYVLAWDELREDWRTFRLDRFKMCSILARRFSPLQVPLPDDMDSDDLERMQKALGDDVDAATIRVAWSIGIGK
ncbi:MAG: WYL domain-containing protein [Corynebacterium sp.]|uniref:helix-turn-helix transcriptional regulator n=1 Tax=Corynebacterium sp. TaxID=1720 RepID=UPI0026DAD728|nr:WYL domain-containing protein [Corynebacterium sp.]MDO5029793.1 WYL domain-containing protein [Corynebacterium sp.]